MSLEFLSVEFLESRILKTLKTIETRTAMRFNNRDDLFNVSFTLKISIFLKSYIQPGQTSKMELLL